MKNELLYGISGLLIGALIAIVAATFAANNNYTGMMGMYTSDNAVGTMMSNDDMSMGQMMSGLQGKTGDNFDKAFLREMIMHHQGAINMANLAKTNAKHDEIKNMANDIVIAQTKEINQMQTWQTNWGY
ncbi:MAG: DUF305 domain-containing protein [Sulfurovaceae bacterium]